MSSARAHHNTEGIFALLVFLYNGIFLDLKTFDAQSLGILDVCFQYVFLGEEEKERN